MSRRSPNMTAEGMREWKDTEAYKDYEKYHDAEEWASETVETIWKRALRVIKGEASEEDREEVENFIGRHVEQEAGERVYGSGPSAVSAHTAALRNWGYDPTGRFT